MIGTPGGWSIIQKINGPEIFSMRGLKSSGHVAN